MLCWNSNSSRSFLLYFICPSVTDSKKKWLKVWYLSKESLSFFLVFVSISLSLLLSSLHNGAGQGLLLCPAEYSGVLAGWMARACWSTASRSEVDTGTVLALRPMPCLTISATPPLKCPASALLAQREKVIQCQGHSEREEPQPNMNIHKNNHTNSHNIVMFISTDITQLFSKNLQKYLS